MPTQSSTAMSSRERIVDYIAAEGGRITSPDGRGLTSKLAESAGYRDLGVLNAMLSRLETEGVITRDIRGRRTFAITLNKGAGSGAAAAPSKKASPAKKATAAKRTTGAKKTAVKKTAAKKTAVKKASAKKTAVKKSTAKKTTAKKTTAKKATKKR